MKQNTMSKEDRKMLNSIFWRSMFLSSGRCGGQVRMHAVGFINSILPALRRYYKDDQEGYRQALMRHTTYFNMTQHVSTVFPLSHKSSVTSPPSLNTGKFRPIRFSGYSDSSFL